MAVILIHAAGWIVWSTSPPTAGGLAALVAVARFCVPAFVLMSGLVLYRRYSGRPVATAAFLKRRWTRVLVPWLFWAAVFLLFALAEGRLPAGPAARARWLALGPGHLYFLLLIAQLYLVMLLVPRGRRGLLAFTAGALALQVGLCWLRTEHPSAPTPLGWLYRHLAFEAGPFWVGYFAAGCLLGAEYERVLRRHRWWPAALAAATAAAALMFWLSLRIPVDPSRQSTNAYLWPSRVPLVLALVLTILWAGRSLRHRLDRAWPVVRELSRHSLGIYALHVLVVTVVGEATWSLPAPVRFPLLVVAALGVSYPVVSALARTRAGAWMVGEAAGAPARANSRAAAATG